VIQPGDQVALPGLVEPHMHLWTTVVFDHWMSGAPRGHH
jgi:cytosine/adenosine deaminase-related metal-dependent hydrolase